MEVLPSFEERKRITAQLKTAGLLPTPVEAIPYIERFPERLYGAPGVPRTGVRKTRDDLGMPVEALAPGAIVGSKTRGDLGMAVEATTLMGPGVEQRFIPLPSGEAEWGEPPALESMYKGPGDRPGDLVSETTLAQALKGQDVMEAGFGVLPLLALGAVALAPHVEGVLGTILGVGGEVGQRMITERGGDMSNGAVMTGVGGVPISGPGVPEPPRYMVARQWNIVTHSDEHGTFRVYFFKLIDGRIMCYNPAKNEWKIWRPKKHIVISRDPRMSTIRKLERTYNSVIRKLARKSKALKLAR